MVIVLVAARYQKILEWINEHQSQHIHSIHLIKQNGPKLFLYVDTSFDYASLIHLFHQVIRLRGGASYVYQFYTLYNGMIDYNDYLSQETKDSMKYYQSNNKDLSQQELDEFMKTFNMK